MSEQITTQNLLDLAAFIKKAAEIGKMDKEAILIHAQHDIDGFLTPNSDASKKCWVPRTVGWDNLVKRGLIE